MRISDWSSDVCSSDLSPPPATARLRRSRGPRRSGRCWPAADRAAAMTARGAGRMVGAEQAMKEPAMRARAAGRERPASTHPLSPLEIVEKAVPEDERVWVPQAPNVWFRPLMLNTLNGGWCNLLRVRKSGVLSRHLHPAPVHGSVLKSTCRHL